MKELKPLVVTTAVEERWVAVTEPYDCMCGHEHRGRRLLRNGTEVNLAVQWHICEDSKCECRALRQVSLR